MRVSDSVCTPFQNWSIGNDDDEEDDDDDDEDDEEEEDSSFASGIVSRRGASEGGSTFCFLASCSLLLLLFTSSAAGADGVDSAVAGASTASDVRFAFVDFITLGGDALLELMLEVDEVYTVCMVKSMHFVLLSVFGAISKSTVSKNYKHVGQLKE